MTINLHQLISVLFIVFQILVLSRRTQALSWALEHLSQLWTLFHLVLNEGFCWFALWNSLSEDIVQRISASLRRGWIWVIACNFLRFGADVCAPSVGGYKPQDLFSILTAQMVRLRFIHVPLLDAIIYKICHCWIPIVSCLHAIFDVAESSRLLIFGQFKHKVVT